MKLNDLAQLTLTSGGTRQALSATEIQVKSVVISALSTNSGSVYVGGASVSSTRFAKKIAADGTFSISVEMNRNADYLDLRDIYWDGTTGDKINVGYIQVGS
jgi:hypothetical protein